jgi:phosphatidate cytidylyltransferase
LLKYRFFSGVLAIGLTIGSAFFLPAFGVWILILLLAMWAQYEFYLLMDKAGIPVFRVYGILFGMALITATFFTVGPDQESLAAAHRWETIVIIGMLMTVFIRQFPQRSNDQPIPTIACTLLGVLYVPFCLNFFTKLALQWDRHGLSSGLSRTGILLCLFTIFVVKFTDMGAFFVGRKFGRHKLYPRLSPGKTWEGFFGGLGAGLLVSCLFFLCVRGHFGLVVLRGIDAVALGLLLPLAAVAGDMFESLLKRAASLKDSGQTVPGMGGILDVVDSLLFGAPVMYVYLSAVVQ